MLTVLLTPQEASALSLAAIAGGPAGERVAALEAGRKKLRAALDGPSPVSGLGTLAYAERYVALES